MLYTACKTGNVSAVQQILDDLRVGHDAGEIPTDDGKIRAAVSRLLCHRSHNNWTTVLHVASQSGHIAIVRLLLQHGADPSLKYAVCVCYDPRGAGAPRFPLVPSLSRLLLFFTFSFSCLF